ncbi:MAG TPA: nuclear transport factor 2 family protein [Puia sp.]|jgi:ketosteroid isomerase-like protein|nr:nuclear transport factor 2 family protein [Puia sp.]
MLKTIIYTMMLVPLVSQTGFAQSNDEKAVTQAVEALRKALIDPDNNTLSGLAADDLSYGHSNGMIQDKAAFIEALTSGKSDFVTIELTEQTVKVVGNTAIVRHHFSATTNDGGKPGAVKLSILLIWQKQKGQWKLLARQAVKLP